MAPLLIRRQAKDLSIIHIHRRSGLLCTSLCCYTPLFYMLEPTCTAVRFDVCPQTLCWILIDWIVIFRFFLNVLLECIFVCWLYAFTNEISALPFFFCPKIRDTNNIIHGWNFNTMNNILFYIFFLYASCSC